MAGLYGIVLLVVLGTLLVARLRRQSNATAAGGGSVGTAADGGSLNPTCLLMPTLGLGTVLTQIGELFFAWCV